PDQSTLDREQEDGMADQSEGDPRVQNLTAADVARGLTEGRMLLVDVREPNEIEVEAYPEAVVVPLSKFDPAAIPDPQGRRVVFVYNWSDYIDPVVIENFSKETGIAVRYDTFDSNDTLEAKLLAGRSGYDVVVPTAYFLERQIKAGVFQKLDKSKLPNLINMWPEITQRLAQYDPGNQYAVNYMWGTTGIGYNAGKARQILGPGGKVDSWDL